MKFLLTCLGVIMVLEGIPYLLAPRGVKEVASLVQDLPEGTLRLIGLALMTGGLLLVACITLWLYPAS